MYVFKLVYHLFDSWSELMFWLLFFSSMTVFIAYKMQMNAFLLLPELGQASYPLYQAFEGVLSATLITKLIAILMKVIE